MKNEQPIGSIKTADKNLPARKSSPDLRPARSADSFDLVNFPFASSACIVLTTGLALIGWSCIVANAPLAALGFFLTLVGGSHYGGRLFDGHS